MKKLFLVFSILTASITVMGQQPIPVKPRILISTDIGGTDPDDNQSMAHFLMYSEMFETEGLVSSPSYGHGSKQNLLDMIDLYEKDLPKLKKHIKGFPSPDALRAICKQGRQGAAPFKGYTTATEGSDWIIKCARKESTRPLWILVWGGLDDLAQALHDAPDIQNKIRVYWIGGPNKKWSTNSYVYIVENFPNLWFIEANASYRGFITNDKQPGKFNKDYYDECIRGAGHLGKDYIKYYDGKVKMGDTPSLLYMMDGDPNNPQKESRGGSFEKFTHSPRVIFNRSTTLKDTVPVYAIIEFRIKGPEMNIPADSTCFTMTTDGQDWEGFYLGNGEYAVRYAPKSTAVLTYKITSDIPEFPEQTGEFVVNNTWPGKIDADDYKLGDYWYTDRNDANLFEGKWQGSKTVSKWRKDVLRDWAKRWELLK